MPSFTCLFLHPWIHLLQQILSLNDVRQDISYLPGESERSGRGWLDIGPLLTNLRVKGKECFILLFNLINL